MFHGLHVVSDAHTGTVITAYWAVDDPDALVKCKNFYDREVSKRNEAAVVAKKSVGTKKRTGQKGVNHNKSSAFFNKNT